MPITGQEILDESGPFGFRKDRSIYLKGRAINNVAPYNSDPLSKRVMTKWVYPKTDKDNSLVNRSRLTSDFYGVDKPEYDVNRRRVMSHGRNARHVHYKFGAPLGQRRIWMGDPKDRSGQILLPWFDGPFINQPFTGWPFTPDCKVIVCGPGRGEANPDLGSHWDVLYNLVLNDNSESPSDITVSLDEVARYESFRWQFPYATLRPPGQLYEIKYEYRCHRKRLLRNGLFGESLLGGDLGEAQYDFRVNDRGVVNVGAKLGTFEPYTYYDQDNTLDVLLNGLNEDVPVGIDPEPATSFGQSFDIDNITIENVLGLLRYQTLLDQADKRKVKTIFGMELKDENYVNIRNYLCGAVESGRLDLFLNIRVFRYVVLKAVFAGNDASESSYNVIDWTEESSGYFGMEGSIDVYA